MGYLKLLTQPCDDGQLIVYWTNTNLKILCGKIHVIVPSNMEDRAVIAELYALQYLLGQAEVLGRNICGHPSIQLVVSTGTIRKLSRMTSGKKNLISYARFLVTRFAGCQISVEKDVKWISHSQKDIPFIFLNAKKMNHETIYMSGVGQVGITNHVVERFTERLSERNGKQYLPGEAWRQLRHFASSSKIKQVDRSTYQKRIKYAGKEGEFYFNPDNNLLFVCSKKTHTRLQLLLTVYFLTNDEIILVNDKSDDKSNATI